ncbi:hypothetical protein D1007_13706 [Hordeum vulgare]|nr:hypothetical protein D1007_13706 [Hordeum vulgare]
MQRQAFPHEGARIDLHCEEEVGCVPQHACFCFLRADASSPTEYLNPVGIRAAFFSFGKLLEADPQVIVDKELALVRVVVLMERPWDVPCDVWPWGCRWGARVVFVEPLKF